AGLFIVRVAEEGRFARAFLHRHGESRGFQLRDAVRHQRHPALSFDDFFCHGDSHMRSRLFCKTIRVSGYQYFSRGIAPPLGASGSAGVDKGRGQTSREEIFYGRKSGATRRTPVRTPLGRSSSTASGSVHPSAATRSPLAS